MKNLYLSRIVVVFIFFFLFVLLVQSAQTVAPQTYKIDKQPTNTWQDIPLNQTYFHLNEQIETLDKQFLEHFLSLYHLQESKLLQALNDQSQAKQLNFTSIKENPGNYLLLMAKMYLYDLMPQSSLTGQVWSMYKTDSRYLLAYFYLKVAAQKYQNAEAYYYLALLDYHKLNPHETFILNLQKQINKNIENEGYQNLYQSKHLQLLDYLKNHRFSAVQHNLFLSSMLGHNGAGLVLGNMFREGLGTEKNCTTALSYYLKIIQDTYVDFYEFRSSYSDDNNFQRQLYAKKKISFQNEQNMDVVESSEFFDSQTIKATYQLAENYFVGSNGFQKNYEKAAQLYAKLAAQDHKNSMAMLGMCYFKGQGVPIDRKRAKILFQHSSKVSISQAMLIAMDYFEIQSKGNRQNAISRMKQMFLKKKDSMNTILKYLFGSLILKGDLPDIKTDEGILLLGSAAKQGHLMAKVAMALVFVDGIDINYDCTKAISYFAQEGMYHPFFMDKFNLARIGLKKGMTTFALIKYLQLSLVGNTNSFINSLYLLQIYKEASLGLNQNSWNLKIASSNPLYLKLKQAKIVPDMHSYLLKQYSFLGQKPMIKYGTLERLLEGSSQITEQYLDYIKRKVIKVCALTKQSSLMNFYEYKMSRTTHDPTTLNAISTSGDSSKLYILESRYLLGKYYHNKSFQLLMSGKDHIKDQYNALKQYKRATNSQFMGIILFYIEEIFSNPYGVNFQDKLFQFEFVNDLLVYTFILSILLFVLYYKRSKKLDEIHKKQLEKRQEENRIKQEEEDFRKRFVQGPQQNEKQNRKNQDQVEVQRDPNQPQIIQQRPQVLGYRIGSSHEDQDQHLVIREVYKFEQNPSSGAQIQKQQEQKELIQQQNEEKKIQEGRQENSGKFKDN